jgi:hypothetical protein
VNAKCTIDRQSIVDMSCTAAERKDMNKNHIGRQSQDVESFYYSIHGTICKNPGIVQLRMSEEFNTFSLS